MPWYDEQREISADVAEQVTHEVFKKLMEGMRMERPSLTAPYALRPPVAIQDRTPKLLRRMTVQERCNHIPVRNEARLARYCSQCGMLFETDAEMMAQQS